MLRVFCALALVIAAACATVQEYPVIAGVSTLSSPSQVCVAYILPLSGQQANPACTNGAMITGSTSVNSPIVAWVGSQNTWVFLEDGSAAYFNISAPAMKPVIVPNVVPQSVQLLNMYTSHGVTAALGVDGETVNIYTVNGLMPGGTPSLQVAVHLAKLDGQVGTSNVTALVFDLNENLGWVFVDQTAATLSVQFSDFSVIDYLPTDYTFVRGTSTAFMFSNIRGVFIDNKGDLGFGTFNLTTLELTGTVADVVPAKTPLSQFQDYDYYSSTWINMVATGNPSQFQPTGTLTTDWGSATTQGVLQAVNWMLWSEESS